MSAWVLVYSPWMLSSDPVDLTIRWAVKVLCWSIAYLLVSLLKEWRGVPR